MKRSKLTEEQITYALRQHEAGTPVQDICRRLGVAEATFAESSTAFTCLPDAEACGYTKAWQSDRD